ncbi:shikimate dehydrogenase [Motilibacter aurantiacus]|uniref:shikimate dehydrogenase n=1 Tax=Motilibacter aurantiacus TaxID=2714955 RepID=UPI001407FD54|nr:shikimate dehydrogenase [Motilibacter aurantiacus]NHC46041.1 shikimate dehydrogenase [Motilibacter aurantiacus]
MVAPAGRRRAAVLGFPIEHSLSPVLHRAAYAALGLEGWSYDAHEVDEAALPGFVERLDAAWAGLSLTMPLKRAVLPLLDEVSGTVRATGAANTLVLRDGRRLGDNTDVPGLAAALRERGVVSARNPVVVGGGATAASAVASLALLGASKARVVVRRPAAAGPLREVGERVGVALAVEPWDEPARVAGLLAGADVVVATTPAGATDDVAAALPAQVAGVLLDVVYAPWPTALAAAWRRCGGAVAGGLDLLVHQATLQAVAMTGARVAAADLVAPMRAAGAAALAARG